MTRTLDNLEVQVYKDAAAVAEAAASQLMTRIVEAQEARGEATVVLTGGGLGIELLSRLAGGPARAAIGWRALNLWWGDERFVPSGDPDRNELQARTALLDHVPLDPARVHSMPASDGPDGGDPEAAAARYAAELASAARPGRQIPAIDVLLLGVGSEGHVASIFPESPAAHDERLATAVRNCPKPPPTRITLTFPVIQSADEVWLIAAGAAKAHALGAAARGAGPVQIPAAGAQGRLRSLWLLDREAAAEIPKTMWSLRT
jgi:6-phosphogluconolactonase